MQHLHLYTQKRSGRLCFILMILSCLIAGCFTSGKPQYNVEKYLLSYPASSWNQLDKLPASVKLNRFSIASVYNSTGMIFRNDEYSVDSFNYSRWAVNPADMIGDSLLTDLRASGLFETVLSRQETDEGRFIISGGIEEFYLKMDKSPKTALIRISITLQDSEAKETGKRMMFQKKYIREEPLQDPSPRGYSQAASGAMQAVSREIIGDIYQAVKATVQPAKSSP